MNNPMDRMSFSTIQNSNPIVQQYKNAMSNPRLFEEQFARSNPQAYEKAKQIMQVAMNYKYYNRNPNSVRIKDCVCRAISTATGLAYEAVDNLLDLTSKEYNCDKLCVCCYDNLLQDILCYPRFECNFENTVEEIAIRYPRNKLLIRIDAHLTCSIYGTILDIWDCSSELVDCYWIV